jgi:hypothetical protein
LSGFIYDTYQFNPAVHGTSVPLITLMTGNYVDYYAANLQAGFGTLGSGGQIFASQVRVDTPALSGSNGAYSYVIQ